MKHGKMKGLKNMTISSSTSKSGPYNGNGVTTVFARNFRVLSANHLKVYETVNGVTTEVTTGITKDGIGFDSGNVTFATAPATGAHITLVREVPLTQETDYSSQGKVSPEQVEDDFDLQAMQMQDIAEIVSRAIRLPINYQGGDILISTPLADRVLMWNAAANKITSGPSSGEISNAQNFASEAQAAQTAAAADRVQTSADAQTASAAAGETPAQIDETPVFSVDFNDRNPLPNEISFHRTSKTTRRNLQGHLETVGQYEVAHDFDENGIYQGVQIFKSFEQLLPTNAINDTTASPWMQQRANITPNAGIGPDGLQSFDKLIMNSDNNTTHYSAINDFDFEAGKTYTLSFFVKPDEIEWLRVTNSNSNGFNNFYLNTSTGEFGTIGASAQNTNFKIEKWRDGIKRVSVTWTHLATETNFDIVFWLAEGDGDTRFTTGDGLSGLYLDFVNITKSKMPVPFYPEQGIRTSDDMTAGKAAIGYEDGQGSIYLEAKTNGIEGAGAGVFFARSSILRGLAVYFTTANAVIRWRDADEQPVDGASGIDPKILTKMAAVWGQSGVLIQTKGDVDVTRTAVDNVNTVATEIWIGRGQNAGFNADDLYLNGNLKSFSLWNVELSVETLQKLANRGLNYSTSKQNSFPQIIRSNNDNIIRVNDIISGDIDSEYKQQVIQNELNKAVGKTFVFNTPYGVSSRPYNITHRNFASFTVPSNVRIEGQASSKIDCSSIANSGTPVRLFNSYGVSVAEVVLSVSGNKGDVTITLGSTGMTNLSPSIGDKVSIVSDALFINGGTVGTEERGEIATVIATTSTTLTIDTPLQDDYLTSDNAAVKKLNMNRHNQFNGLILQGCGQFATDVVGDRAFHLVWMDNLQINGCESLYFDNGSFFYSCVDSEINNFKVQFDRQNSRLSNQYGIGLVNACQNVLVHKPVIVLGKHGIIQTESGTARGVARDVKVTHADVRGTWNAGVSAHTNAERFICSDGTFINCNSAIEMGCRKFTSRNNTIRNLTYGNTGVGIIVTDIAEDCKSIGDTVEGGRFGFRCNTISTPLFSGSVGPTDIEISHFKASMFSQAGVEILYNGSAPRQNFKLERITTREAGNNGSSVGAANSIRIEATSTADLEKVVIDGADLQAANGNVSGCIFMTGVTNGRIRNVDYSGHTAPIIQHSTDVTQTNVGPL